jgi:hypothetical protein
MAIKINQRPSQYLIDKYVNALGPLAYKGIAILEFKLSRELSELPSDNYIIKRFPEYEFPFDLYVTEDEYYTINMCSIKLLGF